MKNHNEHWKHLEQHKIFTVETSGENYLYSIEEIRDNKRNVVISYFFAGWTMNPSTKKKMRIEGTAFTLQESKVICASHRDYVLTLI